MRVGSAFMIGVGILGCSDSTTAKPTCESDPSLCVEPEPDSAEPGSEPPDSGVQPETDSGASTPTERPRNPELQS